MLKTNKIKRINLRVTEKDYEKISKKAKMNMSQYVSLSALGRDFVVIEDLKEASEKFLKDEFTSRYSAFGITEGAAAVDVIFKKKEDDEVTLSGLGDFL